MGELSGGVCNITGEISLVNKRKTKIMKRFRRIYAGTDAKMLETSDVFRLLFEDDLGKFTAFDSTLTANFVVEWKAKIVEGYKLDTHHRVKAIQGTMTAEVFKKMGECRSKYKEVKFFAEKAFPNNAAIRGKFGTQEFSKVRAKQLEMMPFMTEMYQACMEYKTELIAEGMTQTKIDAIKTLQEELLFLYNERENYAREKKAITETRIETLNACYRYTKLVMDAAKIIFEDDYARTKMFVFGARKRKKENEKVAEITLRGEVSVLVAEVDYDPDREFDLENNGPAEVVFYLANSPDENAPGTEVVAGEQVVVASSDLGSEGKFLYARLAPFTGDSAGIRVVF